MKKNKYNFISFEGIDGSGKSTHVKNLHKYLLSKKKEAILTREPGGTKLGNRLRNILLHNKDFNLSKRTEMMLYASDRVDHIENLINPNLKAGKIVLTDRYIDSNIAYQSALGIKEEEIKLANAYALTKCMPDITFYLKIDYKTYLYRNKKKEKDKIEKRGEIYIKKVIKKFNEIATKNKERIFVIDGTLSKDEILKIIIKKLDY